MSAAHTPGPWGIEQTRDMLWVGPMRSDGRKVDVVVVGLNTGPELTMEAALRQYRNAHLIAAAPELLEALLHAPIPGRGEEMMAFRDRQDKWLRDYKAPAIAKARGQA